MKRILAICCVLLLLVASLPISVLADPVSATVMANAFAQAIASYGAANGVSMVFDVSSTDQIGQTVHDLWTTFRDDNSENDDWDTLAATLFPNLYYKVINAAGTAAEAAYVGMRISDTFAEHFDDFYNWLLSGPLEMQQVDNQYYQFSSAQIGPNASPEIVVSYSSYALPTLPYVSYAADSSQKQATFDHSLEIFNSGSSSTRLAVAQNNVPVFVFYMGDSSTKDCYVLSDSAVTYYMTRLDGGAYSWYSYTNSYDSYLGMYLRHQGTSTAVSGIPYFTSWDQVLDVIENDLPNSVTDDLGIAAYNLDGTASFPDTADPNYDATHRAKDIPLDQPWDDSLYGDGTGSLSSVQSAAIADDLSSFLEMENTIDLLDSSNPPFGDLSEVYVPFLPVTLPSFNFSLSGIWHYVRTFIQSISAWMSTLLSIWAILPVAISIPVYASAVVVIVLGVYRRFFM